MIVTVDDIKRLEPGCLLRFRRADTDNLDRSPGWYVNYLSDEPYNPSNVCILFDNDHTQWLVLVSPIKTFAFGIVFIALWRGRLIKTEINHLSLTRGRLECLCT